MDVPGEYMSKLSIVPTIFKAKNLKWEGDHATCRFKLAFFPEIQMCCHLRLLV